MPKRYFLACAIAAAMLAACSNYNPYSIYGTPSTPTPVPSYSPNPAITSANVTFSIGGTPIPNQPIAMSTPDPTGAPGTAITTVVTNSSGVSTFTNLVYTATYCWSTMYTPAGAQPQQYSACVPQSTWGTGVHLGNP